MQPGSLGAATPAWAGERLIVGFAPHATGRDCAEARQDAGTTVVRALRRAGAQVLTTDDALRSVARLRAAAPVRFVEVDHRLTSRAVLPNDPAFPEQWSLDNTGLSGGVAGQDIRALAAWKRTRGAGVLVATLDTGVDQTIADLRTNLWTNPGEVAGNALDDDGNGKVDDVHRWNFVFWHRVDRRRRGARDARGGHDRRGDRQRPRLVGVAHGARLLAVKVLDASGSGYVSDTADGFEYAADRGAAVVNASLGGTSPSRYLKEALARHPDVVLVAAAGDEAADVDASGRYPCAYDLANVVCVAASTDTGELTARFLNFGATTVELAAPGQDILSWQRWP